MNGKRKHKQSGFSGEKKKKKKDEEFHSLGPSSDEQEKTGVIPSFPSILSSEIYKTFGIC